MMRIGRLFASGTALLFATAALAQAAAAERGLESGLRPRPAERWTEVPDADGGRCVQS